MRQFIIGAVAIVTGLLAAGGVALTTRRRRDRDEVLPLEVAPPLGAGEPEDIAHASVEADFGPTVAAAEAETPVAPKRKRVRRKPAKATTEEAPPTEGADAADTAVTADTSEAATSHDPDAAMATEAPSDTASAAAMASDPPPAETPGARTAEAAEIAAAAEAAELSGRTELPPAS